MKKKKIYAEIANAKNDEVEHLKALLETISYYYFASWCLTIASIYKFIKDIFL